MDKYTLALITAPKDKGASHLVNAFATANGMIVDEDKVARKIMKLQSSKRKNSAQNSL
ncbi:hypothetical protein [Vibrio ponticus]|uniref:hypothetical protein n=1 Tax=Vibrio ponticus TaxID=265668 RepID=UPI00138683F6|nr:hypothetical protein [Vibrio ponticus]